VAIPDIKNNRIIDSVIQIMEGHPKDTGHPRCPICLEVVDSGRLEEHVNHCIDAADVSAGKGSLVKNERTPLPKLCYPLVSDRQLRKILKDFGLATNGDKQALIKRHSGYILAYNSECNSLRPLSLKEIRQKVAELERIRLTFKKREFSNDGELERHGIKM
jgi:hypothetical protein